jgi:integrase
VTELLERYLRDHSAPNKATSTHRRDKSLTAHLIRAFGAVPLDQLRPVQLADYKASRRAAGSAPKTVNDELTLLGHAYKLALLEWEWVTDNPVLKVKKEKLRSKPGCWLTPEEEARLLAASPRWLQELLLFALNTGMRQSEILNLQWTHVDLSRRTLLILEQKNGGHDTLSLNATASRYCKPAHGSGRSAPPTSFSTTRDTAGMPGICYGHFMRRAGRRGLKNSGSMTCGTHSPAG